MKPVSREILRLAWPAIATNVTTPLLSLVDIAIVGHIGSVGAIGAVAVGGTMFSILYFMFAFLRMGTSGLTSQAFGASDVSEQRRVFYRGLSIAVAGGLLLILSAKFLGDGVLRVIDADESVRPLAKIYFLTAIFGAPGVLITNVVSGWLLGMQRSRPIMWIALFTNLFNIALSSILVFGVGLGVEGVAAGTATAQISGAVIGLLTVRHFFPSPTGDRIRQKIGVWKKFFTLNADIFLRTLCLSAVTLWFTHAGARTGSDILAANSLLLQLFLVFSYFMDGFAFAGEALAGRFYGAHDGNRLQTTIKALLHWGIIMATGCSVLYFFCGQAFLGILTDSKEVLNATQDYIFWIVSVPFAGFLAFLWDGIFIGLTRSRWMLWSMFSAMSVYFVIYFSFRHILGNHALWLAFVVYLAVRGVVAHLLFKIHKDEILRL